MLLGQRYYDSGAAGEGGGGGGDAAAEAEIKEFETLTGLDSTTYTPEQKARFDELSKKYEVEELDEKGNKITPEAKAARAELEKKVNAILAKEESTRTEEEKKFLLDNTEEDTSDKRGFYDKVDELNDQVVEVDYAKAGIKDPSSVEGVALREKTIRETAVMEYEAALQERAPRAYALMLHLVNGGKESDFFAADNEDFSKVTLAKDDTKAHEVLYRKALTLKGNSPDEIDALVQTAKDSKKLYDKAKSELEALQASQTEREEKNRAQVRQAEQLAETKITQMADLVEGKIKKGDVGGIAVPFADRAKFLEHIGAAIVYNGKGGFNLVKTVKAEEIDDLLKAEYFAFKKGDLKAVATNLAKTERALKIKGAFTTKVVQKGQGATGGKLTLADI